MQKFFRILLFIKLILFCFASLTPNITPVESVKKDSASYRFETGQHDFYVGGKHSNNKNFKRLSQLPEAILPFIPALVFYNKNISLDFFSNHSPDISFESSYKLARAPPV